MNPPPEPKGTIFGYGEMGGHRFVMGIADTDPRAVDRLWVDVLAKQEMEAKHDRDADGSS